ncbi:MAG: hypothetical protein AAF902_12200 [Chloroflexota bacterium]
MDGFSILGIGGPEFLFILILAGIFLGPGRIAQVARWLGNTTAKLQLISRGFMNQLKAELDMAEGQEDLRDMLKEMQDLRNEVNNLQSQISQTLKEATDDTGNAFEEFSNSIRPPTFEAEETAPAAQNGTNEIAPPAPNGNGSNGSKPSTPAMPPLPTPIAVEDDPE